MNRILFVGICLVGIVGFVFTQTESDLKQPQQKVAKVKYHKIMY